MSATIDRARRHAALAILEAEASARIRDAQAAHDRVMRAMNAFDPLTPEETVEATGILEREELVDVELFFCEGCSKPLLRSSTRAGTLDDVACVTVDDCYLCATCVEEAREP